MDHARQPHLAAIRGGRQIGGGQFADPAQLAFVLVQRMGGDEEAEGLLLETEQLILRPFGDRSARQLRAGGTIVLTEKTDLVPGSIAFVALRQPSAHRRPAPSGPRAHSGGIERAALD